MLDKVVAKEEINTDSSGEVKTEVVAAYHELLHKLKQNKKPSQASHHPHMAIVEEEGDLREVIIDEVAAVDEEEAIQAIVKETPEEYNKHIMSLKYVISQALDEVNQQYLAEHHKLTKVAEAIERKTKRIADLHDIEVNIDTLAALLMAQKEKERQFEQEMHDRRQQFEHEMTAKRRELQLEEQKYIIQRDLAREKDRNRYEMSRRDLEQELADIRQKAYKELEEREARVGSAEELQERIAQFPEELRLAAQKAKDATTKQLTIQFEYENQLAQKDLQLHQQKISTLEAKIATLESSITHFESLKNSFNHLLFNKTEG